jgi:hypothetical protein
VLYLLIILSISPSLFTLYLFFSPYLALSYLLILSSFPFLPPHYLLSCPAFPVWPHFNSYSVQLSLSGPTLPLILPSCPCLPPLYLLYLPCNSFHACLNFIYLSFPSFLPAFIYLIILYIFPCLPPCILNQPICLCRSPFTWST